MSEQQGDTSPMVVTLDRFNMMRNDFTKHYYLSDCNANFGGQEIQVSWSSFSLTVHNFVKEYRVPPHSVALRFVHCYDSKANVLYVRMQILTMSPIPDNSNTFTLNDGANDPSTWYELSNSTIIPTDNHDLFDLEYLNYFYYCNAEICGPDTVQNLAEDTSAVLYARTVTMPWLREISQLYIENGLPTNATLCIDAGSMYSDAGKIAYQHTLVAYMRKQDGTPMLDNEPGLLPFHNKAADCGTLCPSYCSVYIIPTGTADSY